MQLIYTPFVKWGAIFRPLVLVVIDDERVGERGKGDERGGQKSVLN